ncbi:putative Ig domain-containing protein, partial [Streptococcus suis]
MTRRQKRKKQLRHQQLKSAAFAAATVASLTFTSPQAIKAEELKTTAKNPEVESKSVVENPLESAQTMEFVEEGAAPAISEAPSQETPVVASETSSTEDSKPATSVTYTVEYRDKSGQLVHQVIKTAIIAEGQDSVTVTENAIELVNDEALANYYDETGESLTRTATITRGGTATISYTVSSFEDPSKETVSTPQRDVTVNYDVVYTEAGLEVYRETRSYTFKTYDTVGSTSVVVSPDLTAKDLQGYALSADSSATQVLNLTEGQSHPVTFEVKGASKERDTRKVEYSNGNTAPYLTIENYTLGENGTTEYLNQNSIGFKTNGTTVNLQYKIGFTRIDASDLELTDDAKKLGLTLDTVSGYITGPVELVTKNVGNFQIGFQSKTDPSVRVVNSVSISSHVGLFVGGIMVPNHNETWLDYPPLTITDEVTLNNVSVATTPFGYFVGERQTVNDANSETKQYFTGFSVAAAWDQWSEFLNNPLAIFPVDLQVLDASPGVAAKLVDIRTDISLRRAFYEDSTSVGWSSMSYGMPREAFRQTPYYVQLTELPATQGSYFIKFKLTDNIGKSRTFTVNFNTFENSIGRAITNADVKFNADSEHLNPQTKVVQVPISNEEQIIGTVVLNKENAWIREVKLPAGTKLVATKTDSEGRAQVANVVKEAGTKLNPGTYTFEVKAVDGHYGDNAPNRIFTFVVTDAINPISHQIWTEGQKSTPIPVSMEQGSTITSIRVESSSEFAYIDGDAVASTMTAYGLKQTPSNQTARVYVTYLNGDGTTTETFTDFTYEVQPAPANDLFLDVTNANQTVEEGGTWQDMVITHTDGANLTVDIKKLPKGTRYNASTKTISGIGRYEGTYDIPVIVEKDGEVKGTIVHLVVTPGTFTVPDKEIDITVLDSLDSYSLDVPEGATVVYNFDDYYRNGSGFDLSEDGSLITGTPIRVQNYSIWAKITWTSSTSVRSTNASLRINVKGIKPSLEVTNAEQTVEVGTAIQGIKFIKDDYSTLTVDSSTLPAGLKYDADTNTVIGVPSQVGTYTFKVRTEMPYAYSSDIDESERSIEKTITLNVTNVHPSLTVSSEEQTFSSVTDMTPVTLENDARSTINVSNLPDGVRYDEGTKTISGRPTNGVGDYTITVTASMPYALGGEVVTKTVKLHVTAVAPSIDATNDQQTVTAKDAITTIQVSKDAYSTMAEPYVLLNDGRQVSLSEIGLRY